jgi:tetratricopeptide (TPR) repeat protein
MNCGDSRELISRRLDGRLRDEESVALEAHLAECGPCAMEASRTAAADRLLRGRVPPEAAPDFADRVFRRADRDKRRGILRMLAVAGAAVVLIAIGVTIARPWEPRPEPLRAELERHLGIVVPYAEVAPVSASDPRKAAPILREEARILGLERRTATLKNLAHRGAAPDVQQYVAASENFVRCLEEGKLNRAGCSDSGARVEETGSRVRRRMHIRPSPPDVQVTFPESTPKDVQDVVRGRVGMVQGKYDEAIEAFQNVSKRSPYATQCAYLTAEALRKKGEPGQALNYYCQALAAPELKGCTARSLGTIAKEGELYLAGRRVADEKDATEAIDHKPAPALFRTGQKSTIWVYVSRPDDKTFAALSALPPKVKAVQVRRSDDLATARIDATALRLQLTDAELKNLKTHEAIAKVLESEAPPSAQ